MHEVRERLLAVHENDRDPLPVAPLELLVARDVGLDEIERHLSANALDHAPGALAEMAAGRPNELDLRDKAPS
jgi:hypothetical protein